MTPADLLNMNFKGNILIIGNPAAGKTTLSKQLAEKLKTHTVIHTDEYGEINYQQGLYDLMEDLKEIPGPTLIEGVMGARLLRKGTQRKSYYPDYVINMTTSQKNVEKTYHNERDPNKLRHLKGLSKANQTILKDYRALNSPKPPIWIDIFNDYD